MKGGFGIEIERGGRERVVRKLEGYKTLVRDQTALEALRDALEIIYQEAQARCPVGVGSNAGALARSMRRFIFDYRPAQGVIRGKVTMMSEKGAQLPYAWMREEGGTIVPRPENRIGRLVWEDPETGEVIFAKKVTQRGSHYMRGALDARSDDARAAIGKAAIRARKAFD